MQKPLTVLALALATVALFVALRGGEPAKNDAGLEARVTRLEEAVRQLGASQKSVTSSSNISEPRSLGPVGQPSLETRLAAIEAIVEPWADHPGSGPSGSGVSVRELEKTRQALDEIERDRMRDRVKRWVDQERQRASNLAAGMAEHFSLSSVEETALRDIFSEESDAQGEMMEELWSAPPPADISAEQDLAKRWDEASRRMKDLRAERERKLEQLLGNDRYQELKKYEKTRAAAGGRR